MSLEMPHNGQNEAPTSSAALRAMRLERTLAALLSHGALSRTELAEITGYSRSSMTATIRELMTAGFVRETGLSESTGGRRRTILQFNRPGVYLSLVSVEGLYLTVSQIDMLGTVQAQLRRRLDRDEPLASLEAALRALHEVVEQPSRCVVVSLPGVVSAEGEVSLAPALGLAPVRGLRDALGSALGLPVLVENDVNLLVLGESAAGAAQMVDDVVLLYVGEGIGAALLFGGRVHRGATGSAGEVGFLPWEGVMPASTSSVGPLEANWSANALAQCAAALGIEAEDRSILAALQASSLPEAAALLEGAVAAWAYAAVVNACIVNPELVVFAGEAVHLPAAAQAELAARVKAAAPAPVEVAFARLGDRAIAQGAIAFIETRPRLVFAFDEEEVPGLSGDGSWQERGTD
ncbi:ROK family transcriptional regulator [Propioniciclava sinopodophylli]|uniref:ROK family transcriptional regulator n=1 Tax=Propioniciclava sinopodophylli TaxID=1837344 RepID=UPI0024914E92|nr:ROK family transcriptional regulator [Propioniciclava sinopodophylli]